MSIKNKYSTNFAIKRNQELTSKYNDGSRMQLNVTIRFQICLHALHYDSDTFWGNDVVLR